MTQPTIDTPLAITGFPGFLAEHLLAELAPRLDAPVHLLALRSTLDAARRRLAALERAFPELAGRCQIHGADIAEEGLGLDPSIRKELAAQVGTFWHLAALYDLAVPREIAFRVNVQGTANVLDFLASCPNLERLNYVSTCYVSGTRTGQILEDELDLGQRHKNHYEETKFWAEVEVWRRREEVPSTIFRPSVVVGDSHTGRTGKYDGPYYIFRLLHRLPEWMPVPRIGSGDAPVNLVPVDFVVQAMANLGHRSDTLGEVFHLADPHPMGASQIVDHILKTFGRRPSVGRLPARWVERTLKNQTLEQWTGVPQEALTYFNHNASFDTTNADRALSSAGISCPPLPLYLDNLLHFFLSYPDAPPTDGVPGEPLQTIDRAANH